MHRILALVLVAAATNVAGSSFQPQARHDDPAVPSLRVPACPDTGNITYTNSVPSSDTDPFPETQVAVCYDDLYIRMVFTALEETSFYCMPTFSPLKIYRISRV